MPRVELNEEVLDLVAGGYVQYNYSKSQGKGVCRINNPDLPELAGVYYEFDDLDEFLSLIDNKYQTFGDGGILQYLCSQGKIRPYKG